MCGRTEHRVAAFGHGAMVALAGSLVVPELAGLHPAARTSLVIVAGLTATPFAGGRRSPDVDQTRAWKDKLDRRLPDEMLGAGGPFRHRGVTHWWGLPAVGTAAVWWGCTRVPAVLAALLVLVAWPPLAGWWSHLVSDFVIGARYRGGRRAEADEVHAWDRKSTLDADDEPRGPGIPLAPWWWHVGCGWKVGSVQEWIYVGLMAAGGAAAVWTAWTWR